MTQTQKVLIAESGSGYGGSAKYLASLLALIDSERFSVEVVTYGIGPFVQQAQQRGQLVSYKPNWRFPWLESKVSEAKSWRALFLNVFQNVRYAVFGGVQLVILVLPIAMWLRSRKIKLVHLNNEIISHLPLVVAARLAGAKVLCHLHGWRFFTLTERLFIGCVDKFITISEAGAKFFNDHFNRLGVVAIPNGLSVGRQLEGFDAKRVHARASLGLHAEAKAAVIVGRLVPWKGHEIYLRALAKAAQKNTNVIGIVLGHDPRPDQEYLKKLRRLADELGIAKRVQFLPWQEDVWPIYAAADIVLHTSTEPEPFGLVILEAMFARKPVIATRGGGVTDLIIDGETGFLVPPNRVDDLAVAIERLVNDSQLADQLAETGEKRAKTCFTMETNAAKVQEVYQQLLSSQSRKDQAAITKHNLSLGLKQTMLNIGALRLLRDSIAFKVPILMYHRISTVPDAFFPAVSERTFWKQMEYIKNSYRLLSMDELVECWQTSGKVPRRSLVVTFDDGYAPTWSLVQPVLEKFKIPVTMFLATEPTEKNYFIWTDLLRWWFKLTRLDALTIRANGYSGKWPLGSVEERLRAVDELSHRLKTLPNSERKAVILRLESELGVTRSQLPDRWSLTLNQIKDIDRNYVKFGAHTATHPILSRTPIEEAREEIIGSKQHLEEMLGEPIRHFAYPNGELGDFTEEHEQVVAQAGFDSACSTILGLNDDQTNRYALLRVYAGDEPLASFASRLVGLGS